MTEEREHYCAGAFRDKRDGKGRYDLISPFAMKRLALVMEKGASHYADRNWERGINIGRYVDSALRHINQFIAGETDEDHLGHAMFNLMAIMHTEEMIERGVLPKELNDVPIYQESMNRKQVVFADSGAGVRPDKPWPRSNPKSDNPTPDGDRKVYPKNLTAEGYREAGLVQDWPDEGMAFCGTCTRRYKMPLKDDFVCTCKEGNICSVCGKDSPFTVCAKCFNQPKPFTKGE